MKNPTILLLLFLLLSCSKEQTTKETVTPKYKLSVSAGNGGSVSTEGGSYPKGSEVTITATPDAEFVFNNWSNGATENPLKLTINSNIDINANFAKKKYELTIDISGMGTVKEEIIKTEKTTKEYESGSTIKLTAEPSEGWIFKGWSGTIKSTENPIEIMIEEAKQITATFEIVQYTLTILSTEGGAVDSNGGVFDSSSEITITSIPDNDYIFSHWSDDSEDNPRTITLNADLELTAHFQNRSEIEDGFYLYIGWKNDTGEILYFDKPLDHPWVFEYSNNQAVFTGTVYEELASFPIFKDIGYVPGLPDEALSDVLISRNTINREYLNAGVLNSWILKKIDENDIPYRRTHEEIMALVKDKGFWSDPIYSQIDPQKPETYVIAFLADAERHGVDLSFVDVNQILIEFREEGFAGLSHLYCYDDERVHISYNQLFWNSASYYDIQNERLAVMYHELGHDILNSSHPPNGDSKQIMNQALGDEGPIIWDDSNPMFSC